MRRTGVRTGRVARRRVALEFGATDGLRLVLVISEEREIRSEWDGGYEGRVDRMCGRQKNSSTHYMSTVN